MSDATERAAEQTIGSQAVSEHEVIEFLKAARKTISMHGWCQGRFGDVDSGFCADGALGHVLKLWGHKWLPVFRAARRMVELAIGGMVIGPWNDVFGRSVEQVFAAFRRAVELVKTGALA